MQNLEQNNINEGMIFAAGLGTRMRPLTDKIPKPMVEVNGKKLIDYAIETLECAKIENICTNVFYKPEILEEHLEQNHPKISLIHEQTRLETGGGLLNAKNSGAIKGTECFCINSDIVLQGDIANATNEMRNRYASDELSSILLLCPIEQAFGYEGNGDFYIDSNGNLARNAEKNNLVFSGLQLVNISKVKKIDKEVFSLSEFFKAEIEKNLLGFTVFSGKMFHIGDIKGLEFAKKHL